MIKNVEKPSNRNGNTTSPKLKTRYIVTHGYKGNLSIQTAFKEVIENQVMDNFEKWKCEKSS